MHCELVGLIDNDDNNEKITSSENISNSGPAKTIPYLKPKLPKQIHYF